VEFWCHAPFRETQVYRQLDLSASEEFSVQVDSGGNRALHFQIRNFPPFASKIITIWAQLELLKKTPPGKEEKVDQYLQPQPFVESDQSDIVALAHQLRRSDQKSTVDAIFKWVASNIRYTGYQRDIRGANYALKHKKGDCTEFAALFAALCRASKIPARLMAGYVVTRSRVLKAADYHNWAEFRLNGNWHIADPQRKVFLPEQEKYIAMRVIRNRDMGQGEPFFDRFLVPGDCLQVRMN